MLPIGEDLAFKFSYILDLIWLNNASFSVQPKEFLNFHQKFIDSLMDQGYKKLFEIIWTFPEQTFFRVFALESVTKMLLVFENHQIDEFQQLKNYECMTKSFSNISDEFYSSLNKESSKMNTASKSIDFPEMISDIINSNPYRSFEIKNEFLIISISILAFISLDVFFQNLTYNNLAINDYEVISWSRFIFLDYSWYYRDSKNETDFHAVFSKWVQQ